MRRSSDGANTEGLRQQLSMSSHHAFKVRANREVYGSQSEKHSVAEVVESISAGSVHYHHSGEHRSNLLPSEPLIELAVQKTAVHRSRRRRIKNAEKCWRRSDVASGKLKSEKWE